MSKKPLTSAALDEASTELSVVIGQLVRRMRAETTESDLNLSQVSVLSRLDRNGWMTTADLARAESMKPQSMGAILAVLEEQELVERRAHPTDGRQVLFALTGKGVSTRRKRTLAKRAWLRQAVGQLDDRDQQTLLAAIALIKRLGES